MSNVAKQGWEQLLEEAEEQLDIARAVARLCWQEWRLAAGIGFPPGVSPGEIRAEDLAGQFLWLKGK